MFVTPFTVYGPTAESSTMRVAEVPSDGGAHGTIGGGGGEGGNGGEMKHSAQLWHAQLTHFVTHGMLTSGRLHHN